MSVIESLQLKGGEIQDLFKFLWKSKMFLLIPFVVILLLMGILLIFAQATGIAPFIYTLF